MVKEFVILRIPIVLETRLLIHSLLRLEEIHCPALLLVCPLTPLADPKSLTSLPRTLIKIHQAYPHVLYNLMLSSPNPHHYPLLRSPPLYHHYHYQQQLHHYFLKS